MFPSLSSPKTCVVTLLHLCFNIYLHTIHSSMHPLPVPLHPQLSIPSVSKAGLSFLGFQRYKLGADSALFSQEYTDPSQDAAGAPYTSFGGDDLESPGGGGGQANSDGAFDGTGGYQRQDY